MNVSEIELVWEAVKAAHGKENSFVPLTTKVIKENPSIEGEVCTVYTHKIGSILVFHGSDDKLDWVRNVKADFKTGLQSIFKQIRKADYSGGRTFVAGFSRGGNVAVRYAAMRIFPVELVTWASPGMLRYNPSAIYPDFLHFELTGDLVPHLLPKLHKPGQVIKIGKQGFISSWWRNVIAAWARKRTMGVLGLVGKYHGWQAYDKAMTKWASDQKTTQV